ncbi:hypothetical protein CLAIMM_08978 isoform 2, partial [Cladophialophora immunda]
QDRATRNEYRIDPSLPGEKGQRVQCRHCDAIMVANTTRQRQHLVNCDLFQAVLPTRSLSAQARFQPPQKRPRTESLVQSTLDMGLSKEQNEHISRLAARMIVDCNLPITIFEQPYWAALIRALNLW